MIRSEYAGEFMLRLSKKNIVFFVSLFVLLLSCAFFHHHIICFGAKSILRVTMPNRGSIHFDYEKSKWQNGTFILQNVTLLQKSKLKKPLLHMKAEDIRLSLEMLSFPFDFTTTIEINHPQIEIKNSLQGTKKKKRNFYDLLNSVLFKTHMKINGGELIINAEKTLSCFLNFECGTGKEKVGFLEITTNVEKHPLPQISARFSKEEGEIEISTSLWGIDLGWISQAYCNIFSKSFSDWSIKKGDIKGDLSFKVARRNRISEVRYALELDDFALNSQKYEIDFRGKRAIWKEHYLPIHEIKKKEFHLFFEKIPPYLMGKGELQEAKFFFNKRLGEKEEACVTLDGRLDFNHLHTPTLNFQGTYQKEGKEYPFTLIGSGEREKIGIDLSMQQEEGEKMKSFFLITSSGDKSFSFQTDWINIGHNQVELAERLFATGFPIFKSFQFNRGTCKGSLRGKIENTKLTRLEFDHFILRDFRVTSDENRLSCEGETLQGKGEFDLSGASFIDGSSWELKLSKGNLSLGKQFAIKNFSYEISMHDQYIKPSYFSGSVAGIPASFQCEGLYHHLNATLGLSISPNDLLSLLGLERGASSEMDEKIEIGLSSKIINKEGRYRVEGVAKVNNEI